MRFLTPKIEGTRRSDKRNLLHYQPLTSSRVPDIRPTCIKRFFLKRKWHSLIQKTWAGVGMHTVQNELIG
ncbi:hypothetical protein SynBMKMC1_02819 [Synechococcus sp. BMK-MC-1]|nr:hypothetical protein SynBMKMC1_02819 [Synechococcus sp. BMK-MC-1]